MSCDYKELRKIMIDKDLSINQLCEQTGVSRTVMSGVLNGHTEPTIKTKEKIISVLNINKEKVEEIF